MRLALILISITAAAQTFTQRGFFESYTTAFPQEAQGDSAHIVSEALFRYEASWQPRPWLKLSGAFDARTDTHRQFERESRLDWDDRSIRRPDLSLRRYSLLLNKGNWTFEAGRQFIRWGKADILNPTDRFAPKDYLNVVNTDFLGVVAARATYESGNNTIDLVWQPRFTPSRTPLLYQRWVVLPELPPGVSITDAGARYPGRSQFGARWNHLGSGYEMSLSYFDGFNYLPQFEPSLALRRYYPSLRLYGADAAIPNRFFTLKTEAAYYTSPKNESAEYLLYVLQLERTWREWVFVAGYTGEVVTRPESNPLQFSPERGFARSILGRAGYTISPAQSLAITGTTRQNGRGTWLRFEYSQSAGQHWRTTASLNWIRGEPGDFIGQYHRNSFAGLALRYSF